MTERRNTNERTYERTNVRTNDRKSENYIPPHTSYVGGITKAASMFKAPSKKSIQKSQYLKDKFCYILYIPKHNFNEESPVCSKRIHFGTKMTQIINLPGPLILM